ncbi:MAG TPA: hypothetical protein VFL17_13550 [Anaerolineae bacterium]|nr:hypothetical protein [Anaerolineae bacterium]
MSSMISIPDDLTKKLRAKADERHVPLDALVVDILTDAVESQEQDYPSLEEVVAEIKATPRDPANFQPASESLAEWLARSPVDPSFNAEVWNREWAGVEAIMETRDRAKDVIEGRG